MDYPPRVRTLLDREKADQGDTVVVHAKGGQYEGVLMPHHGFSGEDIVTVKLPSGYNVGIAVGDIESVEVTAKRAPTSVARRLPPPPHGVPTAGARRPHWTTTPRRSGASWRSPWRSPRRWSGTGSSTSSSSRSSGCWRRPSWGS